MSPEDIQNQMMHGGSMAGPAMMFVELNPTQADGTEWDTEQIEELAVKWRELLFTGGFSVQVYSIEDKKILITVQKGWEASGVRDFVVDQPEMAKASGLPRNLRVRKMCARNRRDLATHTGDVGQSRVSPRAERRVVRHAAAARRCKSQKEAEPQEGRVRGSTGEPRAGWRSQSEKARAVASRRARRRGHCPSPVAMWPVRLR